MDERPSYSWWNIAGIAAIVLTLDSCVDSAYDGREADRSLTDNFTIEASGRAHLISRGITMAHCLPSDFSRTLLPNSEIENNLYIITSHSQSRIGLAGGVINPDGTISAAMTDCRVDGLGDNGMPRALAP